MTDGQLNQVLNSIEVSGSAEHDRRLLRNLIRDATEAQNDKIAANDVEIRALNGALEAQDDRLRQLEARLKRMSDAITEVLGSQHVLRCAFMQIRKWKDDPKLNPTHECERIEAHIASWHKRLVEATKERV